MLDNREQCWLCEALFKNKTDLHRHVASAAHRRLTVVCPWCLGQEKYFTRVADLEIHVYKVHVEVHVRKSILTRANGFFLARYPTDYARVVGSISVYDSEDAHQARKAVRKWCESFRDAKKRTEEWNDGWKEGSTLGTERRSTSRDTRSVSEDRSKSPEKGLRGDRRVVHEGGASFSKPSASGDNSTDIEKGAHKEKGKSEKVGYDKDKAKGASTSAKDSADSIRSQERSDKNPPSEVCKKVLDQQAAGTGKRKEKTDTEAPKKRPRVEEDGLETYDDNICLDEEEHEVNTQANEEDGRCSEILSNSSSSSSSTDASSTSSKQSMTNGTLISKAMKILAKGAMPVCPPARRIWNRGIEIELGEKKLVWPPSNWRALSPDQRLLAHEQMALFLERGANEEFPQLSRKVLVDKYAFLMLDGEAKPKLEDNESEKIPDKLRQYNLAFLKGLVSGEIGDSRTAWSILKSLENVDRWKDTDEVVEVLDNGGVKVKV